MMNTATTTTPPPQDQVPAVPRRRSTMHRMSIIAGNDAPLTETERAQQLAFAAKPWPWSMFSGFSTDRAVWITGCGCLSSATVLAVRLYLDHEPMAYLIHSIIVFFDMILIHCFTHSLWLSVTGEVITYVFFLSFHFTKETVWELFETVLLAVLSSFYMIGSRKQVIQERNELEDDIESLREKGALLLRNIGQVHAAIREKSQHRTSVLAQLQDEQDALRTHEGVILDDIAESSNSDNEDDGNDAPTKNTNEDDDTEAETLASDTELTRHLLQHGECSCSLKAFQQRLGHWLTPFHHHSSDDNENKCNRIKCYREVFFEYFLDGAAGVMYTSFLGLIIDAFLSYGESSY